MRYRIVEKIYGDGEKYYIAQYLHREVWSYLDRSISILPYGTEPIKFSSCRQAKRALKKKARELKHAEYSALAREGNI